MNMMEKFDELLRLTVRRFDSRLTLSDEERNRANQLYDELGEFIMRHQK